MPSPAPSLSESPRLARDILQHLLKHVSRSFYLTLRVLPKPVRQQTGLAYLFARAADTIADTDLLERARRLECLERFKDQFRSDRITWEDIQSIQAAVLPHQKDSSERVLLQRLDDCFRLY
ncbi:MAG: squalene/phytoene synthase family protein, partial [Actinobacteria bacterium]|nr:squalene/phytoene synthase family protein [Actinomycetota bacterium]